MHVCIYNHDLPYAEEPQSVHENYMTLYLVPLYVTCVCYAAAFQNPAVVEALLQLMGDEDPNVRAVAAISLGRTGRSEDFIVDALIKLLDDKDRIVRQSACLSLGTLKAVKAVKAIGNIW